MKKIIIIGSPGAGKSYFAKKLHEKTRLPLFHLDLIWHKADRTTVTREEFDTALARILQKEAWILDGNYSRTLETRLQKCDTVFLLDLPLKVCMESAQSRIGKKRDDLPWVEDEDEELDEEFRQFILDFPKNTLPGIYRLLEACSSQKNITIFRSREDINKYIQSLLCD